MTNLIEVFSTEVEVTYRDETYLVRDNGAIFRKNIHRGRARPLDKEWTFGRQSPSAGYMHIAGIPIHRIICTAFHGAPETEQHVVDHIDTNRANNRPENLRWVTKLENILLNPITTRRVEILYGSLEAFFANPSKVLQKDSSTDFAWMRTVSKEQAGKAKQRLLKWSESGNVPSGGALGEWLYGTRERGDNEPEPREFESLTPTAIQVDWRVPTEFPCCPLDLEGGEEEAFRTYARALKFGVVFAKNHFSSSLVVDAKYAEAGIAVLTRFEGKAIKDWAVAHVSFSNSHFYHKSIGTFFELQGALKYFCEITGDTFDDDAFGELFDDFT
jgi:hypothetical protein